MSNSHNSLFRGLIGVAALAMACAVPVLAQDASSAAVSESALASAPAASQEASQEASQSQAASQAATPTKEKKPANEVRANNDPGSLGTQELDKIGKELFVLFVVVTLLESALASLFQWRGYQILLNGKAWKMPILFVVGLIMVKSLGYDPFLRLLVADKVVEATSLAPTLFTWAVSALIIAGGSAGVNGLFKSFGIRNDLAANAAPAQAPTGKAWVSVLVKRKPGRSVIGPVQVLVAKDTTVTSAPVVGVVDATPPIKKFMALFTANSERFPGYGGHEVESNAGYTIKVKWGPNPSDETPVFAGIFADRAIVDLVVEV